MKLGSAVSVSSELLMELSYNEEHDLIKSQLLAEFSRSMINHFEPSVCEHKGWDSHGISEFTLVLHVYTEQQYTKLRKKLNHLLGKEEAKIFLEGLND